MQQLLIDAVWKCCIIHASLTTGDVPLLIFPIINTDRSITFQNLCSLTNDIL